MNEEQEKYLSLFKSNISNYNKTVNKGINDNSLTTRLNNSYNELVNSISVFSETYKSINDYGLNVANTMVQLMSYIAYIDSLRDKINEYKELEEIVSLISDDNSEINTYLTKINKNFSIYLSEPENYIYTKNINDSLHDLGAILKNILTELKIFPSDAYVGENGKLLSDLAKSYTRQNEVTYDLFSGSLDRSGFVGQRSLIYIKKEHQESNTGIEPVTVSIPLLDVHNRIFSYNPKTIVGVLHVYDFTGTYEIENDGSDDTSDGSTIEAHDFIRFGNIFSGSPLVNSNQSIRYKIGDEGWTSGKINYLNTATDKSFKLDFINMNNVTRIPEAIHVERVINYYKDYEISGTLKFDQEKTNDYYSNLGTTNDGKVLIFGGTVKIGEEQDSLLNTKKVYLKLENTPDLSYSVDCYLDNECTSNASTAETDSIENLIINAFCEFVENNIIFSNDVYLDNKNSDIFKTLFLISNLSFNSDEDISYFKNNFHILYGDYYDQRESSVKLLDSLIEEIKSIGNGIINTQSSFASSDSLYCSDYLTDIVSLFTNLTTDIETYTSDDDESLSDILTSDIEEIKVSAIETLSECLDVIAELFKLNDSCYSISGCDKNTLIFSESLEIFNKVLTGNTYTSEVLTTAPVLSFDITSYNDFASYHDEHFHKEYLEDIPTYLLDFLYLFTQTKKLVTDEGLADLINKGLNFIILKIITLKIGNESFENNIKEKYIEIIKNYLSLNIIQSYNDNTYFIRPQLYKTIKCKLFNYYDIDKWLLNYKNGDLNKFKPCIYKGLISSGSKSKLYENVSKEFILLNKINKNLNIRELIFKLTFFKCLEDLDSETLKSLNIFSNKDIAVSDENDLITYIEYKKLLNIDDFYNNVLNNIDDETHGSLYKLITR